MNMLARVPTETEMEAFKARRAFRAKIDAKAAALAAAKLPAPVLVLVRPEFGPDAEKVAPAAPEPVAPRRNWFWLADSPKRRQADVRDIQEAVAEHFGVSRADLMADRRTVNHVRPRQIAYYLARELTPLSMPAIGLRFGGRDHTTVLHGFRKVEALALRDIEVAHDIATLANVLTDGRGI